MSVKADKRRHSPIRWIFILLFLIVVLIGVILGVSYTKLGKINSTPMNQSKLVTVHEDANMKDYTNIALFGIDSQTGSMSDRGNRSDSIIVVSINNQTKEIKMLSIYRDTYVSVNGHYTKINAAYSMGGPELAVSTINRNLDLNITQYATVNFKILADIVDAIGGIEVKVDSSILKNLNSYIGDMNRLNGGDSPKIKPADCIHWMGTRPSHIQESAIPQEEILPVPDGSVKFFRRSLPKAKKSIWPDGCHG